MKVKDLIKMLKSNGIKGNSEIRIDCISDTTIYGCVIVEERGKEVVILTDDMERIEEDIENYDPEEDGYDVILNLKHIRSIDFYEEMRKKK